MHHSKERRDDTEDTKSENSRHQHHGRRRHSSKTRLVMVLGVAVALETALLVAAYVRMSLADKENMELAASESKQAGELAVLKPQVETLREEIAAITQSRLPGLQRLEFDKVIPVEKDYVKNVVFSVAGKGDQKHYEYKLVMHNPTLNLIHPQVDILFFDRVGIQVGLARIGVQNDGTPTLEMMDRGEIRSFSSRMELTDDVQPEYFRLRIAK